MTKTTHAVAVQGAENNQAGDENKLADVRKNENVFTFELTDNVVAFASRLGVNLQASADSRLDQAARDISDSFSSLIKAGIALLSLQSECEHGEFYSALESRGIPVRTAYNSMTHAKFLLSLPEKDREKALALPKTKVLTLAKADPEVLQDLFDDDENFRDITTLSVRDMRLKIRELEARLSDRDAKIETLEDESANLRAIADAARDARIQTGGSVPIVVQDVRLECAALFKKGELALDDIGRLVEELFSSPGQFGDYELPVARNLYLAASSLMAHAGGIRARMAQEFGDALDGELRANDLLSTPEVAQAAAEYKALIGEHEYETEVRRWEREMERPAGRGRPRSKPQKKA